MIVGGPGDSGGSVVSLEERVSRLERQTSRLKRAGEDMTQYRVISITGG